MGWQTSTSGASDQFVTLPPSRGCPLHLAVSADWLAFAGVTLTFLVGLFGFYLPCHRDTVFLFSTLGRFAPDASVESSKQHDLAHTLRICLRSLSGICECWRIAFTIFLVRDRLLVVELKLA